MLHFQPQTWICLSNQLLTGGYAYSKSSKRVLFVGHQDYYTLYKTILCNVGLESVLLLSYLYIFTDAATPATVCWAICIEGERCSSILSHQVLPLVARQHWTAKLLILSGPWLEGMKWGTCLAVDKQPHLCHPPWLVPMNPRTWLTSYCHAPAWRMRMMTFVCF